MTLPTTIVRSPKRKRTVALHVEADGTLTVTAPLRTSLGWINAFIREKAGWIARRQKAQAEKRARPVLRLCDGCMVPYLGQELRITIQDRDNKKMASGHKTHRLRHCEGASAPLAIQHTNDPHSPQWIERELDCRAPKAGLAITIMDGYAHNGSLTAEASDEETNPTPCIPVSLPANLPADLVHDELKTELVLWYKKQARHIFAERMAYWATQLKVSPSRLIITNPRRRWGSCNAKNEIRLNWRLIMATPEVLDYVIVHELCHIPHKNHGKRFWRLVGTFIPQVSEKRQVLRNWEKSPFSLLFA